MRSIVTGAPYSGIETVQSSETLADGNRIVHKRQTTVYRDSQARMRTEETITPPAATEPTGRRDLGSARSATATAASDRSSGRGAASPATLEVIAHEAP